MCEVLVIVVEIFWLIHYGISQNLTRSGGSKIRKLGFDLEIHIHYFY